MVASSGDSVPATSQNSASVPAESATFSAVGNSAAATALDQQPNPVTIQSAANANPADGSTTIAPAPADPATRPQIVLGNQVAQTVTSDVGSALNDSQSSPDSKSAPSIAPLQYSTPQISASTGGAMPGTITPTGGARGTAAPSTPDAKKPGSMEAKIAASGDALGGGKDTGTASKLTAEQLAHLGLQFDADGNAIGLANKVGTYDIWWKNASSPVTVRYDFRSQGGYQNQITDAQKAIAVTALNDWSAATGGKVVFVQDTSADASQIINIGVGDLQGVGYTGGGSVISLGGGQVTKMPDGQFNDAGVAWLDATKNWSMSSSAANPSGTYDFYTIVAHEVGHALGFGESLPSVTPDIMSDPYQGTMNSAALVHAVQTDLMYIQPGTGTPTTDFPLLPMNPDNAVLASGDVKTLLARAAGASTTQDAIIAVVDRNGAILGVRVEAGVLAQISDPATLVFAIDGAVAEARTAAMFSNDQAPLTSRTVEFISQSTITQREVQSTPDIFIGNTAAQGDSTIYGPGFVAPIGLGGHFPPGINFTSPVDLFDIEHTNRDTTSTVTGTRFDINPAFLASTANLIAPESYGTAQNSGLLPGAQSRGFGTLPGGIPIFQNNILVGGIGVFFPGPHGYSDFEQGFVRGANQTEQQLMNSPLELEAEFMAFAAVGGVPLPAAGAAPFGLVGTQIGTISGINPVAGVTLPFGVINLGGIILPIYGASGPVEGVQSVMSTGRSLGTTEQVNSGGVINISGGSANSGADQPLTGAVDGMHRAGQPVSNGWLVVPHDAAPGEGSLTAADVEQIIDEGIQAAKATRAAIRLPLGSTTHMAFAVCDNAGNILGLYRMQDATTFSTAVAVAKARNVAYYNNPATALAPTDQVVQSGVAFSNRTFRFLAEPRYPAGIDGTQPPQFSTLNDPGINGTNAENLGAPLAAKFYTSDTSSVAGHDAFVPQSNFHAAPSPNQNGIVFFPGSTSVYRNGKIIGGFGVSGDGVDQDDTVTFVAAQGYLPGSNVTRADQVFFNEVRLPFIEFLRNAFVT